MTPPALPVSRPHTVAISPASLGRAVRRYSLVFALFALLAAGAGSAVWFLLPLPQMSVAVTYHVAATPPTILYAGQHTDFGTYKQQQQVLLRSKQILNAALADPAVAGVPMLDPAKVGDQLQWLANNIRVDYPLSPEHMRVSLDGDSPEQLLTIMKAIAAAYGKVAVDRDKTRRQQRLQQLETFQKTYLDKVRDHRERLRKMAENAGGISGDPAVAATQQRVLEMRLGDAESGLAKLEASIRDDEAMSGIRRQAGVIPDVFLNRMIETDATHLDLKRQQAETLSQLQAAKAVLVPGVQNENVIALEKKRDQIATELAELPMKLKPRLQTEFQEQVALDGEKDAEFSRLVLAKKNTLREALKKDIAKLVQLRTNVTTSSFDLSNEQQDALQAEMVAMKFGQEIEMLRPEIGAQDRITLYDEPSLYPGDERNRRVKYTAMAVGGFLLLGLACVQWLEYRNRRVLHSDEISNGLGLAVLGAVPFIPKVDKAADQAAWSHLLAEAVNTTRAMILAPRALPVGTSPIRTILVTSASSGEGKTSLVTHLAVSLAGAGRRVLVIDADMRRPAAHTVLGLDVGPGLADYLLGVREPDELIKDCRIDGLSVITAGRWQPAAAAGLSTERWHALVRDMAARYDYVLVDSPPILPVADSLAIARTVDGVVVAVMRDHSRFAAVQTACGRLHMVGARVMGVVMSGTKPTQDYYYDKHYYRAAAESVAQAGVSG